MILSTSLDILYKQVSSFLYMISVNFIKADRY